MERPVDFWNKGGHFLKSTMSHSTLLDTAPFRGWTLRFTHPNSGETHRIAATVPGNVELDLQRAGLIGDPMPVDRLDAMQDWETVDDWLYESSFDAPVLESGESLRLVLEGVNTVAEARVNGETVMHCENMLIPHGANLPTGLLRPKGNVLEVFIRSALLHARRYRYDTGMAPARRMDSLFLRKARHLWGWDNAPRLPSAGLWRPVRLEVVPAVRFEEVYFYTHKVNDDIVLVGCDWRLAIPDRDLKSCHGVWRLRDGGEVEREMRFEIDFEAGRTWWRLPRKAVRLWWPRGMGEPALYEAELLLFEGEDCLARHRESFGIRDIRLDYTAETTTDGGGSFIFRCNGEPVFIRGTNWKPLDALHSRAEAKVGSALEACLDLNCNMIRIWGGGIYESAAFFDFCDAHGIMVWQDFMFACEIPPQDADFRERVRHEAESVVRSQRNHPSLVLWCGDNEIDAMYSWDQTVSPHARPSQNLISRQVLPEVVRSFDPYRVYLPSSPHLSDRTGAARRAGKPGPPATEEHLYPTDANFRDIYRRSAAHFIGETGPFYINAIAPSPNCLERERSRLERLWEQPIDRTGYSLALHQEDRYCLTWKDACRTRLRQQFGRDFPLDPFEDFALGVNILCAEMFKFAIEWSRARKWRKTGVLWWSLADMWPVLFNYSVMDFHLRPKQPCYDWIRAAQQPFALLVADPEDGPLELLAANDTLRPLRGSYRIFAVDAFGAERELRTGDYAAAPNANTVLHRFERPAARELWVLCWRNEEGAGANHFITGEPPYDFSAYAGWVERLQSL